VRLDRGVADERYINYALNSPQLRHQAAEIVHGVGRPRLGLSGIRQLKLPVAPLAEQHEIVGVIEEQFSRLDDASASLRRSLKELGALEDAIHATALRPDAPEVRLADVCRTSSGGTPRRNKAEYFGGNIPWIKSGELGDSEVTSTAETITEVGLRESSAKLFPRGTLLIAMYGATIGKLGWVGFDHAATNQAVAAIMPNDDVDPRFLWHVLRAKRREFLAKGIGGAQYNISQEILRETMLPLPSLDSQRHLVGHIERTLDLQRHLTRSVNLALSRARSLRRSILSAAFSGKLPSRGAHLPSSPRHDLCDTRPEEQLEPSMQQTELG
jgi:type I restriction enzyme S subunit